MTRVSAKALRWEVALAAILLLGATLRFHGLEWDKPAGAEDVLHMHPDERFLSFVAEDTEWPASVGEYFDTARSPLNPYNAPNIHSYVYGTFPLFLVKGATAMSGHLPDRLNLGFASYDLPNENDKPAGSGRSYDIDVLWGRRITALFDTATIALVFLLGGLLFGRKSGLTAALLYALAVLPTQLAHFWAMDPYVTFFAVLTLYLSAQSVCAEHTANRAALCAAIGVSVGLGLASKVTAWPIVLAPMVASTIRIGLRDLPQLGLRWAGQTGAPWQRLLVPESVLPRAQRPAAGFWSIDISLLCFSLAIALVVFRIAQPYAFSGPTFFDMSINPQWRADIQREVDFQNGNADFPPFVQFAGRTPFLTPLRNIVGFGLGPALGVTAWASVALGAVFMFKRRELTLLMPLVFLAAVFLFQGYRFVAFMRYFAPIYPVLCLFAGWGMISLWRTVGQPKFQFTMRRVRSGSSWRAPFADATNLRWAARGGIAAVFVLTAWWALAFQNVYSAEHPRITASRWIQANVPNGASITGELWDDTLPYAVPGGTNSYPIIETEPYQTDSFEKVRQLVYGIPGDKAKRGLDNADYVVISSNRVRESVLRLEREYPATIRYYEALESGELGFELVASFAVRPSFLGVWLDDSRAEESFTVYDHPLVRIYKKTAGWDADKTLALLNAAYPDRAVNLLPKQGRTNGLQFAVTDAVAQQRGGTFTDVFGDGRGVASHVPWLWWLVWLEAVAFASLPWVVVLFRALPDRGYGLSKILGLIVVVLPTWLLVAWGAFEFSGQLAWAVFAIVVSVGVGIGTYTWPELKANLRERWQSWLAMECISLLAFFAFLALRAWNPDTWHHPQGGEKPMELAYLTAVIRSTHMPPYDPWFGGGTLNYYYMGWFFLAVPVRALRIFPEVAFNLGVPTFAALGAITAFSTVFNLVGLSGARLKGFSSRHLMRQAIPAGVLGAFLLIGIANLDGGHQAIERFQHVNRWTLFQGTAVLGGAVGLAGGFQQWLFHGAALQPFDWWRSSRVHIGTFDITEFPFWSLLFADLHPHLMDVPFFGLVIALTVAYVASVGAGLRGHGWVLAVSLGLAVGLVRTIHTWDFPTAVLIASGGVAIGQLFRPGRWDLRLWDAVGHLVVVALTLTVLFAPYTAHFEVFNSGLQRAPETTKANQYFAHFGMFVCVAVAFIAVRYREISAGPANSGRGSNWVLVAVRSWVEMAAMGVFIAGLTLFTWRFGLTVIALSAMAEVFLLNLLWLEWRNERDSARALATGMLALAFAIGAGIDVVIVKDDIVRMNTAFKFSLQAWQLYALGGAFSAWYVARFLYQADGWRIRGRPGRRVAAGFATTAAVVLFLGSTVFLYSGTKARQERRFADTSPTLDGLAYLAKATFQEDAGTPDPKDDRVLNLNDDRQLIDWLRANVRGSPVIAEAVGPLYHWTGRISMNTGLPAVIGWDNHQNQQRGVYAGLVGERRSDTARFYKDADPDFAQRYLRKYNVRYVVVGTEELVFGTPGGIQKLASMPALTELYRKGDYAIYGVDQTKLIAP
jgi:YYY domain-containing protein